MEKTAVVEKLNPVFRQVFNNPSIVVTDEMTASDVDGWDSLSHMLLITEVENSFGIKFKLRELNKMKNVGDMIEIIIGKI
jgi:acyl carrier protein